MSTLATRAEILKLARALRQSPDTLAFLSEHTAEQVRRLRDAVYERLFAVDQRLFRRLARLLTWMPLLFVSWLAQRFHPILVARVAGQLSARRAARICRALPAALLADVAQELDPRSARELIRCLPPVTIRDAAVELARRQDHLTLGRFVDFVSDESIRMILEVVADDALLLRLGGYTESKNRLDHLVQLLPESRIRSILALAQDESGDLAVHVLMILTEVSYSQKCRLGDLLAELPEAVLNALVRATQREGLWAELLPVVGAMSPAGLCTVVNLPVLLNPAMLESIGRTADEEDLWGLVLPLVEMMDDHVRSAVAQSMARRGGVALERASNAALLGELWEPLLDIVARMPPHDQAEFARITRKLGDVDAGLYRRIVERAEAYGLRAVNRVSGLPSAQP